MLIRIYDYNMITLLDQYSDYLRIIDIEREREREREIERERER